MRRLVAIMLCLIGMGTGVMGMDLANQPLQIKGTKVPTQVDAKRVAFDAYVKKMRAQVLATEGVQDFAIVTLDHDVRDFASKGEQIWEARVLTVEHELRAILWINPRTEEVNFVCGPWEGKECPHQIK